MSIKYFFYSTLFVLSPIMHSKFTIILDATGDAKHAGRSIGTVFERGLTIQCIQAIKNQIETTHKNIEIITTNDVSNSAHLSASAIFSNRIQPHIYLKLGFYQKLCKPCDWTLYRYSTNKSDELNQKFNPCIFYEINQAHQMNYNITKLLAEQFLQTLQEPTCKIANYSHGLFAIPIQPLYGIQAPCLYFEAGLFQADDWQLFVQPLSNAICKALS
ncbi:hypothetical protein KAZ82_01600 [Candidatus Babeliales bacterium]|nr:hypothetical protein [Candidatus Babeliales bacterium]